MEKGDTIIVKEGWGYNTYDPITFKRSDGTVRGVVTNAHAHPGTVYFRLTDGTIASGAISGMEKEG